MIFEQDYKEQRLKWAFTSCKNGAWGAEPDGENDVVCIRAADFDGQLGRLNSGDRTLRSIDPETFTKLALRPGDIVLEKSGGGDKQLVGRAVLFDGEEPSITSNFLARCRPSPDCYPAFVNYLLLAIYNARGTFPHLKQSTGIQNLDLGSFLDIRVRVPPLETQRRIAHFLDEKTARIDELIDKKHALLDRLAEKRQALITRAVTKGLNPDAPMKDSGIAWLGEIPAHWDVKPIYSFQKRITYGFTNPMPTTMEGPYMLTANDIGHGSIRYETARRTDQEAFDNDITDKSRPEVGDVLITKDGTLGRVAVFDGQVACINQSVALLRVLPKVVDPHYLAFCLLSEPYQEEMLLNAGGTTIKHIYITRLAKMPVAMPALREQAKISMECNRISAAMLQSENSVRRSISLLEEYRAAVVAVAITGRVSELQ